MASRMEKYYQDEKNMNSRIARNTNLYDEIYNNVEYSNVEGIAKIEKRAYTIVKYDRKRRSADEGMCVWSSK